LSWNNIYQIEELIRKNVIRGASKVVEASLVALKLKVEMLPKNNEEELLSEIVRYGDYISSLRPSMISVRNYVSSAISEFKKLLEKGAPIEECINVFAKKCDELIDKSRKTLTKISEYANELIAEGDTILTHSYSNTVLGCLIRAAKTKKIDVIVTESRPSMEGRETAYALAKEGINVTLIVDAAVGTVITNVDKVIVGADSILPDNSIVNKIGTLLIALAAKEFQVPFIVVADSMKKSPSYEVSIEERELSEVLPQNVLDNITAKNPYFEVIPSKFLSYIITEEGIQMLS
jgi:eIF-2B alpha/beta/delta-like uncharacterized protein